MVMLISLLFIIIEAFFILLALLLIVYLGFIRLESRIGIRRDGIRVGRKVSGWNFPDLTETMRKTPSYNHWQFLIFCDYTLESFPSLIQGLNQISKLNSQKLEVLIMGIGNKSDCETFSSKLALEVPIVPIDRKFLNRFNVRVSPFGFLISAEGIVQWVDLINTDEQLFSIWNIYGPNPVTENLVEGVSA